MKKAVIFVMIVIIAASVALIAYSQNQSRQVAGDFYIEVNCNDGKYYYSINSRTTETLTDVYILRNDELLRHYEVIAVSVANSIVWWSWSNARAVTVEIQWNGGRQVLNYQP